MRTLQKIAAALLAGVLALALWVPALAGEPAIQTTILFTHDLHSHFLPTDDGEGGTYGGYARLKTVIDQQREKYSRNDVLLVDGGDFSMGSLFQTAFADSALELRAMGAMGYDATTFGNHEYDYRAQGLAKMLNSAVASGEPLPAIVEANYLPPEEGEEGYDETARAAWEALHNYGVTDYIILEKGDLHYVIFGIMGVDSDECAPMSGMILDDMAETAQRVVDEAVAECLEKYSAHPVVICLSHSGTDGEGKGEDYELAKAVDGIDLIVSGHTHTTITEPIEVNDTYIVSCEEYSRYLGVVNLGVASGDVWVSGYELIPVDDTVAEDPGMAAWIEAAKGEVEENYLADFGMGYDEILAHNPYDFDGSVYRQQENTLGNLLSDAYKWAAERASGEPVDMALTAAGVIRDSFAPGDVTVSDVFNVASLGIGADEVPGYPLIEVWLTGKDLKTAMEIDASVAPLMGAANLYCSGVQYSFNTSRMIFNKVTEQYIRRDDGTLEEIDDDRLYRVVTGLYCGQMLGAVESTSFGLLSVTARDKNGDPIDMDRLEDYILHDKNGSELKEWYAIASYIQSMGGEMDEKYGQPDGRKNVYSSLNPVELLRNPNKFTFIALAIILVLVAVVVLVVRKLILRRSRRPNRRGARGYSSYRGKR